MEVRKCDGGSKVAKKVHFYTVGRFPSLTMSIPNNYILEQNNLYLESFNINWKCLRVDEIIVMYSIMMTYVNAARNNPSSIFSMVVFSNGTKTALC